MRIDGGCLPVFLWLILLLTVFKLAKSSTSTIKIGALLDFNSTIGLRCLAALNLAIDHVNKDPLLLNGTTLELIPANSNCSAFTGAVAATSLLESEVVAIAGPQSSGVSHFVSHMATYTKVPLVSFAATDPTLSEYQYPYFVRLTCSDTVQMQAIASIIHYYGWREVVAMFTDDDYGLNAIDVLSDFLDNIGSKIVYKAALDPAADDYSIGSVLAQLALMESRVFVIHMQPAVGRLVFSVANYLKMLSTGYVWIVTDAIAGILDTTDIDLDFMRSTLGVIGTRIYIPESPQLVAYLQERDQALGRSDLHYHAYELHAYESVWMIAYAVDRFLRLGKTFKFVASPLQQHMSAGGTSDLASLKVLEDGDFLLHQIKATNFTGITGFVQVNKRGDRRGLSFEIVNRVGTGVQVVGYWSNGTGCSPYPPSSSLADISTSRDFISNSPSFASVSDSSAAAASGKLQDVIWPGGSSQVPRGWVVPKNGRPLIIGVPNKIGYKEFVTARTDTNNVTTFHGFCINVFESALSYLPYAVTYTFVSYGNGNTTPNYDALVEKIATREFDAVVGDVTITTERSKVVDFTQPYTTSGLVVLVPVKGDQARYAWAFMRPFTPAMWCTTGAFFLLTGLVIWMLEHKKNRDFRGRPKKQFVTTLWFIFSTLFFSQREKVKSTLGRAVLVIWLFVVLIVTSSYTASLTSILTVEQLTPTIQGIAGLVASNVPIGFQGGSFVEKYLLQLNVPKERLVPLNTLTSYAKALKKGAGFEGVGAIVDELPYVQLFLSSECDFTIAGQEFTKSGWGFAFPKGSQLAIDMSTAILQLSENGELQQIHDLWLKGYGCNSQVQIQSNELNLRSFWGLFLITGVTSLVCLVCYYIRMIWQYNKQAAAAEPPQSNEEEPGPENQRLASRFLRGASFLKSLASFIEEAEINEKDETKYGKKRSYKSRSVSKDRSPEESARASMSERSLDSSARNSMASVEGAGKAELWDLIRELSVTFNSANNKRPGGEGSTSETGKHKEVLAHPNSSSDDSLPLYNPWKEEKPMQANSLGSFKSLILKSASRMKSQAERHAKKDEDVIAHNPNSLAAKQVMNRSWTENRKNEKPKGIKSLTMKLTTTNEPEEGLLAGSGPVTADLSIAAQEETRSKESESSMTGRSFTIPASHGKDDKSDKAPIINTNFPSPHKPANAEKERMDVPARGIKEGEPRVALQASSATRGHDSRNMPHVTLQASSAMQGHDSKNMKDRAPSMVTDKHLIPILERPEKLNECDKQEAVEGTATNNEQSDQMKDEKGKHAIESTVDMLMKDATISSILSKNEDLSSSSVTDTSNSSYLVAVTLLQDSSIAEGRMPLLACNVPASTSRATGEITPITEGVNDKELEEGERCHG